MNPVRIEIPLREAEAEIRDGDLLLFRRRGLIARAGRGEHSHAALAGWWGETLCCLEVRSGYGGRAVTLASQVKRYPGRIDWYQADPDGRWPEFDRQQTIQVMLRYAGENYGYRGFLKVAAQHLAVLRLFCRPETDDDRPPLSRPFCSQACVTATRLGGGVDPVPQLADEATEPADLARSPFYRYRATLLPDDGPTALSCELTPRCLEGVIPRALRRFLGCVLTLMLSLVLLIGKTAAQTCPGGVCEVTGPAWAPEPLWPASPFSSPAQNGRVVFPEIEQTLRQAVVRIENRLPRGMAVYGSGVLIGGRDRWGWILTCDHLLRDGVGRLGVWMPSQSGFTSYEARLVGRSSADDLALLGIALPPNRPLDLADRAPSPGEAVLLAGYGQMGRCQIIPATVLGYVSTAQSPEPTTLQVRAAARDGDSGGPIIDTGGRVVAILWGTDGYRTVGTSCQRIRQFLEGLLGPSRSRETVPTPPPEPLPPSPQNPPPSKPADEGTTAPQTEDSGRSLLERLQARFDELRQRLDSTQTGQAGLSERLKRLEEATSLITQLRERVEKAEATVGSDNLRAVVRQTAADLLAERGPRWLDIVLPAVLTALGWTGPPSLAIVFAARLALRLLERRLRRRVEEALRARLNSQNAQAGQTATP